MYDVRVKIPFDPNIIIYIKDMKGMAKHMDVLNFQLASPLQFNWTGKFIAPDENWTHITRALTDYEFIVMTDGELYIADDKRQYVVKNGEYLIMPPTLKQYGYKPSKCTFYWTHFTYPNELISPRCSMSENDILNNIHKNQNMILPVQNTIPRIDRIIVLLKQLQDSDRKYGSKMLNSLNITAALMELHSQLYLSNGRVSLKGDHVQLYTDIVDYISWRIRENFKVSEIAEYFGYNEKYITTFFKKASGVSLKTYILNQKMDMAKALLSDTNKPISQIGYEIGFSDNHNFSSAFKKITGQSPSDYRNTYAQRKLFHE